MAEKKTFYITTSIPYVNAVPHIGHAEEFVQCDAIARYQRLMGMDTWFLSGTDDNALKNVLKAEEVGKGVADYVNEHAEIFQDLLKKLNISNDDFIRTSVEKRHIEGAQKLWSAFKPEDVEKKTYKGMYCVGCEEFKLEKDLLNGECPEHPGKKLEEVEEENYFFKLANYQKQLEDLIVSDTLRIIPESRKNEMLSFIRGGLADLSISRSRKRARGWGVPVPNDEDQMMYVWVDALSNYITALGYSTDDKKFQRYWVNGDEIVHGIGKGISRFHSIYWPAFLLSAGISLPKTIFVHGYITVGGQKMSKSIGNVISPFDLVEKYGIDATRYLLLRHVHPFEDTDVTWEKMDEWYNANLANGLGNLVARVMKMAEDNLDEPIEQPKVSDFNLEYTEALDGYDFQKAADYIWKKIGELDEKITVKQPFKLVKEDPERAKQIIRELLHDLYIIGRMLNPIMPETNVAIKEIVLLNKMPKTLFPRKD